MRGGQLVMEEMRSQAELGCPAAVGNCHDQISRKRVARRSFWGGGRKHWQWLAKKWHRADADDLGNFATIKSPVRLNARGGQRVNTARPTGLARLLLRGKLLSRCCCPVRVGGSAPLPPRPQPLLPGAFPGANPGTTHTSGLHSASGAKLGTASRVCMRIAPSATIIHYAPVPPFSAAVHPKTLPCEIRNVETLILVADCAPQKE